MKEISNAILFGFKEILNWNTMKYIILSGVVATVVWMGIGFFIWDWLIAVSAKILEMVPFSMVRSNGAWMLSTFLWFQITLVTFALIFAFGGNLLLRTLSKTIEKGVAFLIAFYFIYNAIVVTMLFFASLFSEPIIEDIEIREFAEDDVVRDNIFKTVSYTVKDSAVFIAVSLLAFPLLFIPILNIFIQVALWMWLTKDTISYDALSLTHEKVEKELQKRYQPAIWTVTIATVLFNFVPVLNIFGPYFGTIALFHYFKSRQQAGEA